MVRVGLVLVVLVLSALNTSGETPAQSVVARGEANAAVDDTATSSSVDSQTEKQDSIPDEPPADTARSSSADTEATDSSDVRDSSSPPETAGETTASSEDQPQPDAPDDSDPYEDDTETPMVQCDPELGCENEASLMITLSLSLMIVTICMIYLLHRYQVKRIPESTATILLGIAVGLVIRMSGKTLSQILYFNPETFFLYLLPPIIFEGGYSLNRVNFFKNLIAITVFAVTMGSHGLVTCSANGLQVVGTIISTIIVGVGA